MDLPAVQTIKVKTLVISFSADDLLCGAEQDDPMVISIGLVHYTV